MKLIRGHAQPEQAIAIDVAVVASAAFAQAVRFATRGMGQRRNAAASRGERTDDRETGAGERDAH